MKIRKLVAYGLGGILALTVLAVAGGLIWRASLQSETQEARVQIDPKLGVDELFKTKIGGIDQWFHTRGLNRTDPVLLYLHGGPGTPMMPFESLFQSAMEMQFIVVNWDQRCAGKTYFENPDLDCTKSANYGQMVDDAADVVDLLKRRYEKRQIIVLGHSWGSILGLGLIQKRPRDIAAYVGTGQVVDMDQNEAIGYKATLDEARRRKNAEAIRALEGIAPYPDSRGLGAGNKIEILRDWENAFGFGISRRFREQSTRALTNAALASPEYSLRDMSFFFKDLDVVIPQLMRDVGAFKTKNLGTDFQVPMFFFLGRHDWQTPSTLAAQWKRAITAPSKKVIWFENSAHFPMIDEADAFARALTDHVKPLAIAAEENR
jgi:proline iminopeptidase